MIIKSTNNKPILVDDDFPEDLKKNWHINRLGYVESRIDGHYVLLHRILMNALKGEIVDHINGDPSDNRLKNLRLCTHAENMRNRKIHTNNKTGVKGIYPHHRLMNAWRAQIRFNGIKYNLGTFFSIEDAKEAYNKAALSMHAEFASH